MTKEEIIQMARQAGFERLGHDEHDYVCYPDDIEAFAKLVAEQDCVGWFGYDTGLRLWFETNEGDDGAIPLYKRRRTHD